MKNHYSLSIIVFVFFLIQSVVSAQEFQGKATYKTHRKMEIKIDSTNVKNSAISADMQKQLNEMLKKQFQREYTLTFTPSESIYKQEETLNAPQPSAGGMQIMVAGNSASDILYKNTKGGSYTSKQDIFGKIFLIKDSLSKPKWKLEKETKNIGQYTCYKATFTREVEVFQSISSNGETDETVKPKMEMQTVTAWYTPQIPINGGPEMYWGLPGLILEVNDGRQTIICSKIVLNPKDKITIKAPKKGKVVTQERFEEIMEKKQKEMMERYRGNRHGEGEGIEIRIGG